MRILREGNVFCIENGLLDAEYYCAAEILHDEHILIAVNENGTAAAWNAVTGKEITSLLDAAFLPCAEPGWGVLVSKDLKAVRKVPAENGKNVYFSGVFPNCGGKLAVVPSKAGLFGKDVYYSSRNSTSWEKIISGFEYCLSPADSCCVGMTVKNSRLCQVLVTLSGKILEISPSATFHEFDMYTEQAAFQVGNVYLVYDTASGKELFRTSEAPRNKIIGTESFWYSSELCYYAGQVHPIPGYVPGETTVKYDRRECLHVRTGKDTCYLLNIRTGRKSDCYSAIEAHFQNPNHFLVRKDGKQGILNQKAELIFPPEYDDIQYVSKNATYILEKDGKCGRADKNGSIISPVVWDSMSTNDSGNYDAIMVWLGKKIALMTPKGGLSCEPFYGDVIFGINKFIICCWKYPDKEMKEKPFLYCFDIRTGETVLEGDFDDVQGLPAGCLSLHKNGLSGVFDVVRKEFVSEMAPCHISKEGNNISIYFPETGKTRIIHTEEELL